MRAEFLQFFVQDKTGRVSRDFKQHTAGFAEINGMKIRAINYRCGVVAKVDETLAPLKLFGFDPLPERQCDAPNRPRRDPSQCLVDTAGLQLCPVQSRRRRKPKPVARFVEQTIAEALGEQSRISLITFQRGGDTVKAAHRMLCWNRTVRPWLDVCSATRLPLQRSIRSEVHQDQAIESLLPRTRRRSLSRDMVLFHTL